MKRLVTRLSAVNVLIDRDAIPSWSSTICTPQSSRSASEKSWSKIAIPTSLRKLTTETISNRGGDRVVVFGEQHDQPSVLRAQLVALSETRRLAESRNLQLVLVLEQFNFLQDPLLLEFMEGQVSDDTLIARYGESKEGFDMNHYLPLLHLAKELGVPIHGGFPPREWASLLNKQGIGAVVQQYGSLIPVAFAEEERWTQVRKIGEGHVAYLRSMMRGTPPVLNGGDEESEGGGQYEIGILPAQTLKDTFLAYTIDQHLQHSQTINMRTQDKDSHKEHGTGQRRMVFVVCGLGHCEFRFGAIERIKSCLPSEICVIASKDREMGEWIGDRPEYLRDGKVADIVVPYDAV